jgi:hypothetical protein
LGVQNEYIKGVMKMVRKIIGTVLLLVAGLIAAILFTYGGPVFPHITGPIVFGAIGIFLLVYKTKVA